MTFNVTSVGFLMALFGMVLLLLGIVGGGFELKEFRIPKVGPIVRASSVTLGILFVFLGLIWNAAEKLGPSPPPSPPSSSSVDFAIHDSLGESQVSEQVSIVLDGKYIGDLTVDAFHQDSMLNVTASGPGLHSYTADARAVFLDDNGDTVSYNGTGQGSIDIEQGKDFDLVGTASGNTWLVTLVERR